MLYLLYRYKPKEKCLTYKMMQKELLKGLQQSNYDSDSNGLASPAAKPPQEASANGM